MWHTESNLIQKMQKIYVYPYSFFENVATKVQSESPTSFEKVVDTSFEKKKFLLIFSMN